MAGSSLASLLCETRIENGSEDPCIASLRVHLGQLDRVSQRFIGNPAHRDLVTFGPYVGRSILESALTAILLRFDPFRSRSLDRFAKHPRYDANDIFKHRIQWSGDIYPSDAPPQDVWNPELKVQSVSRALFSAHTIDAAWVPAAEAMLDFTSRTGRSFDLGFFQSQTPPIALGRYQGEIRQLYSFLSKGVHGEFFLSQLSPLDAETCLEKLTTVIEFVAQLGLASHFAYGFAIGVTPGRAVQLYQRVRGSS